MAPRPLLAAVGLVAAGALVLAAYLQHVRGFEPCPWCVLQRLLVLLVALAAGIGALLPMGAGRLRAASAVAAALLSVAGVATAIYQHVVAARSDSCALTLADRVIGGLRLAEFWPAMFEATARCDEANLPWLGVPFALWGALTFLITASGSLLALQGTNRQA
ncbi:MAG: disulfide bond formation protein B [Betaproteobacteria bacterium]